MTASVWLDNNKLRQPKIALNVDWSNSVTNRLASLVNVAVMRNSVTLSQADLSGTIRGRADGVALVSGGIVSYTPRVLGTTQTLMFVGRIGAYPGSTTDVIVAQSNVFYAISVTNTGAISAKYFNSSLQTGSATTSSGVVPIGRVFVAFARFRPAGSVDAIVYPTVATTAGSFTPYSIQGTSISHYAIGADDGIFCAAVWERMLSVQEVASLSVDPWQMFKRRGPVMMNYSAIMVPTLSAAKVTSVSSTAATPRVTLTF